MKEKNKVFNEIYESLDEDLRLVEAALTLVEVDDRKYKVYNTRTKRFHNQELGIDIV